jgi:hypothetical protein
MSKLPPRVWVLNLDAEHELATSGSFTPSASLRRIVATQRAALLGALVAPGDYLLLDPKDAALAPSASLHPQALQLDPAVDGIQAVGRSASETRSAGSQSAFAEHLVPVRDIKCLRGLIGVAWSPTPSALALLRSVGAVVPPSPSIAILRAVNARPFTAQLRGRLELDSHALSKYVASNMVETLAVLSKPAPMGWLVRRTFGAAGRGRMRIESIANPGRASVSKGERVWLVASLQAGPLVLEPWVEITEEYTRSAWLHGDGTISISAPCFQETRTNGAWEGTRRTAGGEVARADDSALAAAVEGAGRALHSAGYHGPFGVDAFRHKSASTGQSILNPMSEINARFTMDWTCAMGKRDIESAS